MFDHRRTHLPDDVLLKTLAAHTSQEQASTAVVIADIAEVDRRRLYLGEGHPSMYSYCVHVLHFSEDQAYKRIQAARVARRFPEVFRLLAEGRLHLSAVVLLAPHLAEANAPDLLAAAVHRTRRQIESWLAERFPRPDLPVRITALGPALLLRKGAGTGASALQLLTEPAPGQVGSSAAEPASGQANRPACEPAPGQVGPPKPEAGPTAVQSHGTEPASGQVAGMGRPAPAAPQRFALQVTVGQEAHDLLRYAQALLGHEVPSGDLAEVLRRALRVYVDLLEKNKFAKSSRIRSTCRRAPGRSRHIPADVRRRVWVRDAGRCTFVGDSGQRCPATSRLEFDHVQEYARGGETSVTNLRLRCRAHNQYTAERTFGAGFMEMKRASRGPRERMKQPRTLPAGAALSHAVP